MKRSDFNYSYPDALVARHPPQTRGDSRLLVLNRATQVVAHKNFSDITEFFQPGEVLVLNDTRVFPARLLTQRSSGGRQEILLIRKVDAGSTSPSPSLQRRGDSIGTLPLCKGELEGVDLWEVLINANTKIKSGAEFAFDGLSIKILDDADAEKSTRTAELKYSGNLFTILEKIGHIPLPPYLGRGDEPDDHGRYQTVFAKDTGSVAAPTAGLHFTDEILRKLEAIGVNIARVTLHVGPGTFLPVRADRIKDHKMHSEFYSLSKEACDTILQAKKQNRKVTAVGTTAVRVLETAARQNGNLTPQSGMTDIFIYPPYGFKIVDRLLTNFHQPESTLLMLVSAFAGRETVLNAYQVAIEKKYRLFSYGDAMLID